MDILKHNRSAWDKQSADGESPWVRPVDANTIQAARNGHWTVILTPLIAVPNTWFANVKNKEILCLASGGGQQVPVLAAAGAKVTSFDNSAVQLEKDRLVANREGLSIATVQGDMADLSCFADAQFDLIFHPISNVFCEDIRPVWHECARVLRPGGRLLSGFMNPCFFLFDHDAIEQDGVPVVRFALPYSDTEDFPKDRLAQRIAANEAMEFSHSLDTQIGEQLRAGFMLADFYEDHWDDAASPLNRFMTTSMATLAIRVD